MNNYAYATVITKDFYLPFLIRQKQLMEKFGCKYPFVAIISDSISENTKIELKKYNIQYKEVPTLKFKCSEENTRYEDTLNKFHCFNLTEYDKVFFLDADIILFENLDYLFDKIEFINEDFLYLILTNGEQKQLLNNHEEKRVYASCVMFLKPSIKIFNEIIELAKNGVYNTDEEFIHENKFFYNCLHPEFNDKIFRKHIHFSGLYKLHNTNENEVLIKLFNYEKYSISQFYSFMEQHLLLIEDYFKNKIIFNDYIGLIFDQSKNISFNCYLISLKHENEIPLITRMIQRLYYLGIKNNFIVVVSESLMNYIDLFKVLNIDYIIVKDNENNINYLSNLIPLIKDFNKIIYFEKPIFFNTNPDDLFNEFKNYKDTQFQVCIFDPKIDLIFNTNNSIVNQYLNLNAILLDKNIINFADYPSINGLFFSWSTIKFNNVLTKNWRRIKIVFQQLTTLMKINQELNEYNI